MQNLIHVEQADLKLGAAYQLLDSGDLKKVENFGGKILARPSSLCIWKSAKPLQDSHFEFIAKKGWTSVSSQNRRTDINSLQWQIQIFDFKLKLELQNNGQIGIFPEHSAYLALLDNYLSPSSKVLNLFAYTGLATIYCAKKSASVSHLDLSKKALDWANDNLKLNPEISARVSWLKEDALQYIKKEVKRGSKYQVILADPPSFSRISDKKTWSLEQELPWFCQQLISLLDPKGAVLVLSCHLSEYGDYVIRNIMLEALSNLGIVNFSLSQLRLVANEKDRQRVLPLGFALVLKIGSQAVP